MEMDYRCMTSKYNLGAATAIDELVDLFGLVLSPNGIVASIKKNLQVDNEAKCITLDPQASDAIIIFARCQILLDALHKFFDRRKMCIKTTILGSSRKE